MHLCEKKQGTRNMCQLSILLYKFNKIDNHLSLEINKIVSETELAVYL